MPVRLLFSRVNYSFFFVFLLTCLFPLKASETYFAAPYVQGFLTISVEKPLVNEIQKENPPSLAPKENLKILVWNIYKGQMFSNKPLPFSLQGYDFSLIQEETKKNLLAQITKPGWSYFLPTFNDGENTTGLSLYSRYKATKTKGFHTSYSEPFIITPKGVLIADFGTLRIINVHSLNFVPFSEWKYELDKVLKETLSTPWVVLAGDFNTWSDERLKYLLDQAQALELKEVVFKGKHDRTQALGNPIDHIFAKGFKLRDSQVIPMPNYSDHQALEVTLKKINSN